MRSSEGRPFQVEGPTTEKSRVCLVEVRAKGTRRIPCWDERSDRELIAVFEVSGSNPTSRQHVIFFLRIVRFGQGQVKRLEGCLGLVL